MATEVVMPKLGATMEEGTIVSWLIQIGDEVEEGDPIAEIQTDKIIMELEAEEDGILLKTLYDAGATVSVHEVVAYLGEEGENVDHLIPSSTSEEVVAEDQAAPTEEAVQHLQPVHTGEKIRRTPAARKLAEDEAVNLREVTGTGPLGRIHKADVEQYIADNAKRITPLAKKVAQDQGIDYTAVDGTGAFGKVMKDDLVTQPAVIGQEAVEEKRVPFKGMRKIIADRMSESVYTAPHVTLTSEVDMTNSVTLRGDLLPAIEKVEGLRVSYNDIIMKATAFALKQHPSMNVSLDGDEIVYHPNIHVGMAVAVQDGLVVPVLRNVDEKGLAAITKETKAIGRSARDGQLTPDQMQGSTFTVSNLGMYAVDGFTPIINLPNAAILGVGRIQKKAVVINDEVVVRSMMTVSLSFDHRIIDGAPAAEFLTELKDVLENPFKLMI